jgi:hypothetical protein
MLWRISTPFIRISSIIGFKTALALICLVRDTCCGNFGHYLTQFQELDQPSGFASFDPFQSYSSVATNASSMDYNFYDPLARSTANDNTSDLAWTQQASSSSSTQPTSASTSRVQIELPPRISEGAFRAQYPAFARLLPGFFALASTLAFFMTPVNIFQDIMEDEDTTEDDFTTENVTLLGIGRLAMQLITEFATHVTEQEGRLIHYYCSILRLKYSLVNIVLASYLAQILKWFLVDFYKFRQSVRRAARDIVCVGYGFSATKSVADNIKLYNDIIHLARYAHWFDGDHLVGTVSIPYYLDIAVLLTIFTDVRNIGVW